MGTAVYYRLDLASEENTPVNPDTHNYSTISILAVLLLLVLPCLVDLLIVATSASLTNSAIMLKCWIS